MNGLMDDDEKPLSQRKSSDSSTPVLDNFSRDLIKLAEDGKLDPVVGREQEILRIAQVLSRRKKNNPIILGEPGCGKTAIVEGLAMLIHKGECPKNLLDKRIVTLDLTSVVAGTKYRGQFEERLKVILEELQNNPNIIVFIDEIHTLIGSGNSSGSLDGSNIFKPALARGELQCIGATTLDEYRKSFEKDGALERRFQKIMVDASTPAETVIILNNVKDKYESYHKVAFDILDEVGARAQTEVKIPEAIEDLKRKAAEIKQQKLDVVKRQNFEQAAELRDKERKILAKLESEKKKFEEESSTNRTSITVDNVYDVVSSMTKIPVNKMTIDDTNALINMDSVIKSKVIGQDEAVEKIVKSIRRNRIGIKDPNRPIGSFIFLGSTGVGKTHLAKQIAKEMFGSEDSMIRVDMSEYQEKHTVSRLVGAPPGYVGYDEGGMLTEQVKNKPYSVILFDEVEKAHRDIFSILLQILDDGHVTDSLGRKINFKNTLIIMTTNLGVKKLSDFGSGIGFSSNKYSNEEAKKQMLMKELKTFFSPEFLNRVDDTIVFQTLSKENIDKITKLELDKLVTRLTDMNYQITYSPSLIEFISKVGFDEIYGARPIKRAIQDKVEDFISEMVLTGKIKEGKKINLTVQDETVKIGK
jgi:ATP-dependent Clp protease ATP-binding subunit ClpC